MSKLQRSTVAALSALEASWAAIDQIRVAARLQDDADVPAHAFSAADYATRYGIPLTTAVTQLGKLVREGKLLRGTAMRVTERGHNRPTTVYWPKEEVPHAPNPNNGRDRRVHAVGRRGKR